MVGDGNGNDRIFTNQAGSNGTLPTALGFAAPVNARANRVLSRPRFHGKKSETPLMPRNRDLLDPALHLRSVRGMAIRGTRGR